MNSGLGSSGVNLFTCFEQNIIHLCGFLRFHCHQNILPLILTNVYKVGFFNCWAEHSLHKQTLCVCDGESSKNTYCYRIEERFDFLNPYARRRHTVSRRRLAFPSVLCSTWLLQTESGVCPASKAAVTLRARGPDPSQKASPLGVRAISGGL